MESSTPEPVGQDSDAPRELALYVPRRGRPPHTILSILILVSLSAAALYGVEQSLAPQDNVVLAWDFRDFDVTESPWRFPRLGKEQDGNGVTALIWRTEPGPEVIQTIDTAGIGEVRITMELIRPEEQTPVPVTLEWYWASAEEVAAADGKWPYTTERGVTLSVPDPDRPFTHSARLDHPKWTGVIDRGFFGVKLPDGIAGPFVLRLLHVEFLE